MEPNRAAQIMEQGYVWAESVLLAVCRELEIEDATDSRIASLFGGGIGNTGSVCGAVIGGVMALGLATKRAETEEEMFGGFAKAAEFRRRFEEEAGHIGCRELTDADLTTMEGVEAYMKSDKPMMVCFPAVTLAYRLAMELAHETA